MTGNEVFLLLALAVLLLAALRIGRYLHNALTTATRPQKARRTRSANQRGLAQTEGCAQDVSAEKWSAKLPRKVLFVDVETTGLNPGTDRVVCLAAFMLATDDLRHGMLDLRTIHLVFSPNRKSHPKALEKHGYSDWVLQHQQPIKEVIDSIIPLFEEADLIVAHNAAFDLAFLNAELKALGRPPLDAPAYCTMETHQRLFPETRSTLDAAISLCGLSREGQRHGALEDAWLAMMLYLWQHGSPTVVGFDRVEVRSPTNLRDSPAEPRRSRSGRAVRSPLRAPTDVSAGEDGLDIFEVLFGSKPDAPITPPPNFVPAGPAVDAEDRAPVIMDMDALEGVAVALHYRDAEGEPSRRVILCRSFIPPPPGYLQGHCQLRDADRTFRLDRIEQLVNLSTGEVMEERDFHALFGSVDENRRLRDVTQQIGPAIKVLVFLASVDGTVHDAEQSAIRSFAFDEMRRRFSDGYVGARTLDLWIGGLRPTREMARRATVKASQDKETFPYLAQAMLDLVKADGTVEAKEEKVVRSFIAAVRRAHGMN